MLVDVRLSVCVLLLCCGPVASIVRTYYLAAVDMEWDYAPYGRDLVFNHQSEANIRIETTTDRIGSKYMKAVYKQYTDSTYTHEILQPKYHGYVGPTIKGEIGDMIIVNFHNAVNQINRNFSVHPHGLFYTKSHEGALYLDGESGIAKIDDGVPPGGTHRYIWNITDNFAPAEDDDNCVPWGYHSHVDSMKDIESGLVGVLLTCKKGTLGMDARRNDVQQEIVLYTDITDETDSHYIASNIYRCMDPSLCHKYYAEKNATFRDSNEMYHINGYVYGNLPQLDVCEGEDIALYIFGLSNGMHSMQIYGQTFLVKNHRTDAAIIYPASFVAAKMVPINIGTWLLICRNNDHLHDGMTAFFNVKRCSSEPMPETPPGKLKRYYIAAEELSWNYMPGGKDLYAFGSVEVDHGFSSSSHHHLHHGGHHDSLGNTYQKAVFVEYEDDSFDRKKMKPRPLDEEHLHLLGPPIKVEVGDVLEIVFFNNASRPYSIFPHGVSMEKAMEGTVYYTQNSAVPYGLITQAGSVQVYRFTVPWPTAPSSDDPNCLAYTYHSAVDVRKDTNTGLIGPLLVCKPGSLNEQGRQVHVNKEIFILFNVIDENLSWYIDDTIKKFAPEKARLDKNEEAFKHGNLIHAINGRIYGTLNGIEMCLGDRVSWHFLGMGANKDLHGIGIQGNSMAVNGRTIDTRIIVPGMGFTGYMHPDNVGKWALFCHTHHHLMAGMTATYNVNTCRSPQSLPVVPMRPSGAVRRYYIAAVEIEWDYAPSGKDKIKGDSLSDPKSSGYLYTRTDGGYLGTVYKKVVYREFTDSTFKHEKQRGYREIHLGLLGPFIRGEVGDVIEVVFMNKASYPYSIKPHGVFYTKANEGMKYNDNSKMTDDNEVQPGNNYTYRWTVPQRAGPGPNEPNCVGWLYHSGTSLIRDTPSGLMGPLVTCRRGVLDPRNQRLDHHRREFALIYYIINENRSWYIRENMQRVKGTMAPHVEFENSNMMNAINGYVYGNTPGMVMEMDEHVTWYVMGLGSEDDYHTVHFHGQTYIHRTARSHRGDVVEVFPGTYETVDMYTDNPGTWLLHCHVMKHLSAGMESKYAVVPKGALRPLEDAEKDRELPIVLFRLPVVSNPSSGNPQPPTPVLSEVSRSAPNRTTLVIRGHQPIVTDHAQRIRFTNTDRLPSGPPINSIHHPLNNNGELPVSGGVPGSGQHVLNNPDIVNLHQSGILPSTWDIHTGEQRQRRAGTLHT